MTTPRSPNKAEVLQSLDEILSSQTFSGSPKLCLLLRYLVEKKLAGEATLKSTTLKLEFFRRDSGHDDQTDSIVRRTMLRLRERLQLYYSGEGREDAIRFEFRKGHYLPNFTFTREPERMSYRGSEPRRILLMVERPAFTKNLPDHSVSSPHPVQPSKQNSHAPKSSGPQSYAFSLHRLGRGESRSCL